MFTKPDPKKSAVRSSNNPIESLKDFGSSTVKNSASSIKDLSSGIFEQIIGTKQPESVGQKEPSQTETKIKQGLPKRKEFSLFSYSEYYEREIVRKQIKELNERVKSEIEMLKKADKALLNDLKDIQNLTVENLPETPGVYHIRFLEIIINLLASLRAKIGESRTWLQAMTTKKKKRGSLFANLSKKKGTQYSLSQELSSARSVQ